LFPAACAPVIPSEANISHGSARSAIDFLIVTIPLLFRIPKAPGT
jgi:hypothetical protein